MGGIVATAPVRSEEVHPKELQESEAQSLMQWGVGVGEGAVQAAILRTARYPVCEHSDWTLPEEGLQLLIYYMSTLVSAVEIKY